MLILMIGEFNDSITLQYFPNIVLLFMYYIWHKSVPSCWIVRKFINHFPAYLWQSSSLHSVLCKEKIEIFI